jgi:hypothetical protein
VQTILRNHVLPALFTLALASACDQGEADSEDGGDETGGGELCAAQTNSDAVIVETQLDTAYPTPAGGTLIDGTWDMVRFEVYSPATADDHTRAERLIISGDTLISIRSNNGGPDEIIGAKVTVNGTNLDFSVSCPMAGSIAVPFTATDTELWMFDPQQSDIKIYAKQ